ncbi:sigma-70 family RNA polymerase sigma factor [Enterococcus sp. JM9B]|uniref:sigma-70 family RNA polymerase sigma factor n=1 Tax=Enterococcus sp. JM9B TaxID=1857216 RepID=UPI001DA372BC|nr:sigma-70 family RNA polymerase sigma factor [Enterococcus sp. JM9B]KAF1301195.1 hypothetical protein BAU16_10555 [Enterococcus sp. JM9B]
MTEKQLELAKLAVKGNKTAYEELLIQEYDYIYRTAFLYLHSQEDALDAVQEATFQGMRTIRKLVQPEYFYTWFTRILIRTSGKILTKRGNTQQIPLEEVVVPIEDFSGSSETSMDLTKAMKKINQNYREVLQLFYYQDFSIKEISRLLKIPEGTVKTYLARGRQQLQQFLGGNYYE